MLNVLLFPTLGVISLKTFLKLCPLFKETHGNTVKSRLWVEFRADFQSVNLSYFTPLLVGVRGQIVVKLKHPSLRGIVTGVYGVKLGY